MYASSCMYTKIGTLPRRLAKPLPAASALQPGAGVPLAVHLARKMERRPPSSQKIVKCPSLLTLYWRFLTIWGVFSPKKSKHSPQIAVEWCSQNWNDTRALERFRQKHRRSVGATAKRIFFFHVSSGIRTWYSDSERALSENS